MLLERENIHRTAVEQAKEVSSGDIYGHVKLQYIQLHPITVTVAGNMSATANSANSILLSYTESGVYYLCNVTDMDSGDMRAVNKNVTTQPTNVTGLLPGTTYRVDCVGYRSGGVEVCLEANTAVTTCELFIK